MEPEFREFGDAGVREKERQAFARILSVAKARKVLGYGAGSASGKASRGPTSGT